MGDIKKFYDALASDEALRGRATALSAKYGEETPGKAAVAADLVSFAKAEGYSFSEKELADYSNQPYPLSDDELDAVAGGANNDTAACFCAFGGGGTQNGITCACVLGGGGAGSPGPKLVCPILGNPLNWEGNTGGHGI